MEYQIKYLRRTVAGARAPLFFIACWQYADTCTHEIWPSFFIRLHRQSGHFIRQSVRYVAVVAFIEQREGIHKKNKLLFFKLIVNLKLIIFLILPVILSIVLFF